MAKPLPCVPTSPCTYLSLAIIAFIEGDGTGRDVTPVIKVVDAAVTRVYGTQRQICWMEVYAGEKTHPAVWPRSLAAR